MLSASAGHVPLRVQEETVTEEAKFSSTARDLIDLVVVVRRSCDMHVTTTVTAIDTHHCVGCRCVHFGRTWIGQWQQSPLST